MSSPELPPTTPQPMMQSDTIEAAESELSHRWKICEDFLDSLQTTADTEHAMQQAIAAARGALQSCTDVWNNLEALYGVDPAYKDQAIKTKMTFLENSNKANVAIAKAVQRMHSLALETTSCTSRRSQLSAKSRSSKSSLSSNSSKAQAMASAAAAAENAAFEEIIARRQSEMIAQQAEQELELAKHEAEMQLLHKTHSLEQQTRMAAAEAELQILKARQAAATEKARSDALVRAELEETTCYTSTSPQQTSNDHALQFRTQTVVTPPQKTELQPTAPEFKPIEEEKQQTPEATDSKPDQSEAIPAAKSSSSEPELPLTQLTKEITNTLARQRQPFHEPDVYAGDPVMFHPWKAAFNTMIEQAETPPTQKLAFLSKYTKGEVKRLVDRFRHRHVANPESAYEQAWKEIEDRFGSKTQITSKIIQKLTDFPKFRLEDRYKMLDFADLCADTSAQMSDLPGLNVLHYPHILQPILQKLPFVIHNEWRKRVTQYKASNKTYPQFDMFAKFIMEKARMYNDPELYPLAETGPNSKPSTTTSSHKAPLRVMATKGPLPTQEKTGTASGTKCLFHDKLGHILTECVAFRRMPMKERKEFCMQKGLCFKCGENHRAKECQTQVRCSKCESTSHASFMHPDNRKTEDQATAPKTKQPETAEANTKCTKFTACSMARSCSKIVLVNVFHRDRPSMSIRGYAVLDDQSNACLGDPTLFKALNIEGQPFDYELSTCGGQGIRTQGRRAQGLVMESHNGHKEKLPTVLENENIPGDRDEIPSPDLCRRFPHLAQIADNISEPRDDLKIILLIGRNCPEPLKVRESRNGPRGTPWAQRTDFGWTVSGQMCTSEVKGEIRTSIHRTILQSQLDNPDMCDNHIYVKDPIAMFPQDSQAIYHETTDDNSKALSVEDKKFLKVLNEGVRTNETGNLEFPLPFRHENTKVPNNRAQAHGRLKNLTKTLHRTPNMMAEYQAFFGKILSKHHASPVPPDEPSPAPGTVWYLPHFAVRHPKKKDIRVVFDASAEFDGISLNKVLLSGPDQMNSLLGILLRFRVGDVAVMGDVEQMFHNFHVKPEHRNYLRFLWYQDNDPSKPVIDYRMNVHLFGCISSPAIATFGLRMAAEAGRAQYGDDMAEFVCKDFYVDDGLTSLPDVESAASLIQRTCDALIDKKLRFHKVASNKKDVMKSLPDESIARGLTSLNLDHDKLPTQRSLGIQWSLDEDTLFFEADLPDRPFSRRGVLSVASSIFDPLGLVAPVTIEGKLILREILTEMKGKTTTRDAWDTPLPESLFPRWARWRNSLHELEAIKIQRCYQPPDFGQIRRCELHIFSDASEKAIAAAAYLRLMNENDQPHVSLVFAKAKVTPSHAVSIPRLELCAAVLATTLARTLESEFKDQLNVDSTSFYTDSMIVLGYISNESKRFHVYVANRIHKIHAVSDATQWFYVPTDENPADLASRGVSTNRLKETCWFQGPEFLRQTAHGRNVTPTAPQQPLPQLEKDDPEVRQQVSASATDVHCPSEDDPDKDGSSHIGCKRFTKFSSWQSLKRGMATLIRKVKTFKARTKDPAVGNPQESKETRRPTVEDLKQAETVIIKAVQHESFPNELESLKPTNGTQPAVKKQSPLYSLNPFLHSDGIIRVGGRLRKSDLDLGGRHPVLLPKNNHVSKLIAEHFHREVVLHQGRQFTTSAIRSGGFWLIGTHQLVRSIINACITCKKLRGRPLEQLMADLPRDRVEHTPPFTNIGMDVFGPWSVTTRRTRGGSADSKRWAVLFTCLYSRAIHIEVIESMDAAAFISALRRFIAVRGPVLKLRCDRGTNFVGSQSELKMAQSEIDKFADYLTSRECEWDFNPPHASHFGGVWERQIGLIRRVLDTMFLQLGSHQLTHETLITFMAEASAIINSRPITSLSSDANDPQALSPTMLLTMKTQPLQAPPGDFVKEDVFARKRWRHVQYLAEQFWIRWRREYLQSLQPRRKWGQVKPNLMEDDIVLLRDKDVPRCHWPLARVVKTYDSKDGHVRRVDVSLRRDGATHTFSRPITELVLIERAHAQQ